MSRMPTQTFKELEKAKKTVVSISFIGFLMNVTQSFRAGVISKEQQDILLEDVTNIKTVIK